MVTAGKASAKIDHDEMKRLMKYPFREVKVNLVRILNQEKLVVDLHVETSSTLSNGFSEKSNLNLRFCVAFFKTI